MKDTKRERDQELATTQVKKAVDRVYDLIMGNALFIVVNIHILIFLLFAEPENIVVYYLMLAVLFVPLYPAYTALYHAIINKEGGSGGIYRRFFAGYRKHFRETFLTGIAGSFVTAFLLYNDLFFSLTEQESLGRIIRIFLVFCLMYLLGLVPIIVEEKGTMKAHRKIMSKTLFQGTLRGAVALVILFVSVYFGRILIFPFTIGFSLAVLSEGMIYTKQKQQRETSMSITNKDTRK